MAALYIQTLYIHPVHDYDWHPTNSLSHLAMNTDEWTFKCARQLHEQWPRVDYADLEHLAESLQAEDRWKDMEPTEAAIRWLQQGIPETIDAGRT
jgi:hypothetical protein